MPLAQFEMAAKGRTHVLDPVGPGLSEGVRRHTRTLTGPRSPRCTAKVLAEMRWVGPRLRLLRNHRFQWIDWH